MTAALAVACLFAALLAKGNALQCYQCVSKTGESCTSNSKACAFTEDTCVTAYTETAVTGAGIAARILVRECGQSKTCNQVYSVSLTNMNTRIQTICCSTDNCVPKEHPALPPASTRENGLTCPSCVKEDSSTCSSQEMKRCTGDENKCFQASVTSFAVVMGMKGCATENLCIAGSSPYFSGSSDAKGDVHCTNNSIRAEHGILLAVVAVFMLLKAIF